MILRLVLTVGLLLGPAPADDTDVQPGGNGYVVGGHAAKQTSDPRLYAPSGTEPARQVRDRAQTQYAWRTACDSGVGHNAGMAPVCPSNTCPTGQRQYRLWRTAPGPARPMGLVCSGNGTPAVPAAAAAPPQVTDAMVLAAFRRIPLPAPRSHSQPDEKTLINFDTIFYTEAQPLTRTVTILGQRVRLEIRPSRFTWNYGDGTSAVTSTPGAPYPHKDILHRYQDAHTTVQHHVAVTWSAQWSLNGGPLRPVQGTVTTTGPATPLRIAEASPALSGEGH